MPRRKVWKVGLVGMSDPLRLCALASESSSRCLRVIRIEGVEEVKEVSGIFDLKFKEVEGGKDAHVMLMKRE